MSYAERLARLVYCLVWIVIVATVVVLARGLLTGHVPFQTRVDPNTGTAALLVATDNGTGCQYILTPWGGIMPRSGPDGRQLCPPKP